MTKLMQWDSLITNIRRYEGGDVEFVTQEGVQYRALIKSITNSTSGDRFHVRFVWCAINMLHSGSSWRFTKDRDHLSFFKTEVEKFYLEPGTNRQISFLVGGVAGTLYPKGQNLSPHKVLELPEMHKLRVVK